MEKKRVFFACEVKAPWPEALPTGRMLKEEVRHLTLAFLGETAEWRDLEEFPIPHFPFGKVGVFDRTLFLPTKRPRVVAWHVRWLDAYADIEHYHKELVAWLGEKQLPPRDRKREFLPHVTLCRSPFQVPLWKQAFQKVPLMTGDIHLYESVGNLCYKPLFSHSVQPPFEEIEHTADIAYHVFGQSVEELYLHAQVALAFKFPPLIGHFPSLKKVCIESIVEGLNRGISTVDRVRGCPMKAVSYCGEIEQMNNLLRWEMIVDV